MKQRLILVLVILVAISFAPCFGGDEGGKGTTRFKSKW